MAEQTGFKLTFADGTVFQATENVVYNHEPTPLYPIDGLNNFVAIYNEFQDEGGQDGRADSNMAGLFFGFGAGVHMVTLSFLGGWEGSADTWWDSAADDSAISKLQTLNRALTTKRMDSFAPGELEVGEYNSGGKFNPIPVALGEGNSLRFDPEEHTSIFDAQLTLYECIDLTRSNSAAARNRG